jgi:hypothetical protein
MYSKEVSAINSAICLSLLHSSFPVTEKFQMCKLGHSVVFTSHGIIHRVFTNVVDTQVMRKSITILNIYTIYRLWATVFTEIWFSSRFKAFVIYISLTWP